jgi:hypothetical protein
MVSNASKMLDKRVRLQKPAAVIGKTQSNFENCGCGSRMGRDKGTKCAVTMYNNPRM